MRKFDFNSFSEQLRLAQLRKRKESKKSTSYDHIVKETGITLSTLQRAFDGHTVKLDTLIILCDWMDEDLCGFIVSKWKRSNS